MQDDKKRDDQKRDDGIRGDTFTIVPGARFGFDERARSIAPPRPDRKLPPVPGPTPRAEKVPADEILPRK
jgi:hypothetical protein